MLELSMVTIQLVFLSVVVVVVGVASVRGVAKGCLEGLLLSGRRIVLRV